MNRTDLFQFIASIITALWGANEQNWVVSTSQKLVILAIIISLGLFLWKYPALPELVPLWYGKPWGVDRLAHPLWLLLLPGGSIAILITNIIAEKLLTRDMLVFTQILSLSALLVSILSLVTLAKILFLVS